MKETKLKLMENRKKYSEEDHRTWSILFARQMAMIKGKVCDEFIDGIEKLKLDSKRIPLLVPTSKRLQKLGAWKLVKAEQEYLTDEQWGNHFAKREFPVTDYIRKPEELDFTPLPDIAHDYFGHLAFLAVPHYMRIIELFSKAYRLTSAGRISETAQLWWNTMEFGLIKQDGKIKLLGAGLVSSEKECRQSQDPKRHIPFNLEHAKKRPKAKYEVHDSYFVIESWEQLAEAVKEHIRDLRERR